MKKLATPKARALFDKLTALAERGINGEKAAAQLALSRLKRRYDFTQKNTGGADIFDGVFIPSTVAAPVFSFEPHDFDIANAVKWAIEQATKIRCLYRAGSLCACADSRTSARLHEIAGTLAGNMLALWRQYQATPGTNKADRATFIRGLYDGMMDDVAHGEQLPRRATIEKVKKARKRDVAIAPGLSVHPYSIAAGLGKQIRCCMTLDEIVAELEQKIRGELPEGVAV